MTNDPARNPEESEQRNVGLGHDLNSVDLEQAQQVGADPPGGLALDIGGGTDGLGASTDEDETEQPD